MTYRSSSSRDRCLTHPIIARLVRKWLRRVLAVDNVALRELLLAPVDLNADRSRCLGISWLLSERGGAWNGDT